jgi:hypothetical protein
VEDWCRDGQLCEGEARKKKKNRSRRPDWPSVKGLRTLAVWSLLALINMVPSLFNCKSMICLVCS